MRTRKYNPLATIINDLVIDLPSPSNISYLWNFGSLLGLCLIIQIITGVFLSMHYCSDTNIAFSSVAHIMRDVNYGFILKYTHANGASLFFLCVYIHIGRGLYYGSYMKKELWFSGVTIYILMMATAFIGYVLPWGQMSFWGATVITNLVSAIPYVGNDIVQWLWGGFSVSNATLNRFFSLHYLLPFALAGLGTTHMILLHHNGSSNPVGLRSDIDKIPFHSYFSYKDIYGIFLLSLLLSILIFFYTKFIRWHRKLYTSKPISNTSTYTTWMIFPICIRNTKVNSKQIGRSSSHGGQFINFIFTTIHTYCATKIKFIQTNL